MHIIRNQLKLQSFGSGVVAIYSVSNNGLTLKHTLRFDERTVGMNRFYAAMQNNVKVDMVIRAHRMTDLSTQDIAVVNSVQYRIRQVQYPSDVEPPCMDMSLERMTQKYG